MQISVRRQYVIYHNLLHHGLWALSYLQFHLNFQTFSKNIFTVGSRCDISCKKYMFDPGSQRCLACHLRVDHLGERVWSALQSYLAISFIISPRHFPMAPWGSQAKSTRSSSGLERPSFTHQLVSPILLTLQMVQRVYFNRDEQSRGINREPGETASQRLNASSRQNNPSNTSYLLCPISWTSKGCKTYQMLLCNEKARQGYSLSALGTRKASYFTVL